MNTDIRISISFRGHRKRKKLNAILGQDGSGHLLDLWLSAACDRPKGVLYGLDAVDIALMADWPGDPQGFVDALVSVGFLDVDDDGVYSLHDWHDHNAYAANADVRSAKAKKAAAARYTKKSPGFPSKPSVPAAPVAPPSSIDGPVPPSGPPQKPKPKERPKPVDPELPEVEDIVDLYNEICASPSVGMPMVRVVSDHIKGMVRGRMREDADRRDLEWWRGYFENDVVKSAFLTGGATEFRADFAWLVGPKNMAKVLNGRYQESHSTGKRAPRQSSTVAALEALKEKSNGLGGRSGGGDIRGGGAVVLEKDPSGRFT